VLGVANASAIGPFAIRNRNTNGDWVFQGKRFNFGVTSSPTFFGFFPGFGPIARIRHSVSPTISYTYNPAASVSQEFARAIVGPGVPVSTRTAATQTLSIGLSQNIEGQSEESGRRYDGRRFNGNAGNEEVSACWESPPLRFPTTSSRPSNRDGTGGRLRP
jgi:hypothetical protein